MKAIGIVRRLAIAAAVCASVAGAGAATAAAASTTGTHMGIADRGFHADIRTPRINPALGGVRQYGGYTAWWSGGLGLTPPYVWAPNGEPDGSYYCQDPRGYYPSMTECNSGWQSAPAG
jgi:hypothetical protein